MTPAEAQRILGLSPGFSREELKVAFRRQALRWHPDKNDEPSAASHFRKAYEAYVFLQAELGMEGTAAPTGSGDCPVCTASPEDPVRSFSMPFDDFWQWIHSDDDKRDLFWVFALCEEHYDSALPTVDEAVVARRLDRAEAFMNVLNTAQAVSMSLERAVGCFMAILGIVAAAGILYGLVEGCSR